MHERPAGWLDSLRAPEQDALGVSPPGGREGYRVALAELLQLSGVGPKVADCVCLMGLGWGEAVPVDTHGTYVGIMASPVRLTRDIILTCSIIKFEKKKKKVWQIAQRDYKFKNKPGKGSTLTSANYDAVANHFRSLWGLQAGWAHSVLFAADLKSFAAKAAAGPVKVKVEEQGQEQEQEGEGNEQKDVAIVKEEDGKESKPILVKREVEDDADTKPPARRKRTRRK